NRQTAQRHRRLQPDGINRDAWNIVAADEIGGAGWKDQIVPGLDGLRRRPVRADTPQCPGRSYPDAANVKTLKRAECNPDVVRHHGAEIKRCAAYQAGEDLAEVR